MLMYRIMFSTKSSNFTNDTDVVKHTKRLLRYFICIIVENAQYDVFNSFKIEEVSKEASRKTN